MGLLMRLWSIARALEKLGMLEPLVSIAEAARDGDGQKVRAKAEALAVLTAYKASYRV
jgi:hypothetical protein